MSSQWIPSMTERRASLAMELVPADEIETVYARYVEVVRGYLAIAPKLTEESILAPPLAEELDKLVKAALVALAQARVRSGLKKLAWVAYTVFDPNTTVDWDDPKNALAAVVYTRLHGTDFYLSEFRDIEKNLHNEDWYVAVKGQAGIIQKRREFPMWGIEHLHKLDNNQKALAWYRKVLMDRHIIG